MESCRSCCRFLVWQLSVFSRRLWKRRIPNSVAKVICCLAQKKYVADSCPEHNGGPQAECPDGSTLSLYHLYIRPGFPESSQERPRLKLSTLGFRHLFVIPQ